MTVKNYEKMRLNSLKKRLNYYSCHLQKSARVIVIVICLIRIKKIRTLLKLKTNALKEIVNELINIKKNKLLITSKVIIFR